MATEKSSQMLAGESEQVAQGSRWFSSWKGRVRNLAAQADQRDKSEQSQWKAIARKAEEKLGKPLPEWGSIGIIQD